MCFLCWPFERQAGVQYWLCPSQQCWQQQYVGWCGTTCPQCSCMSVLSPGSICDSARRVLCMFSTTVPLSTSHTHIALEVSGHPLLLQRRGLNVCSSTVSLIQMCFQLCLCIWWQVLLPLGACLQRAHVPACVCCPWKQTKLIKIIAGCHGSCCRCGLIGKAITAACWGVYGEAVGRGVQATACWWVVWLIAWMLQWARSRGEKGRRYLVMWFGQYSISWAGSLRDSHPSFDCQGESQGLVSRFQLDAAQCCSVTFRWPRKWNRAGKLYVCWRCSSSPFPALSSLWIFLFSSYFAVSCRLNVMM